MGDIQRIFITMVSLEWSKLHIDALGVMEIKKLYESGRAEDW